MSDARSHRQSARLLLIDSNEERRAALAASLAQLDYDNTIGLGGLPQDLTADDGFSPDLVLLDLESPGVTAESIWGYAGRGTSSGPIPVVGLTSDISPAGRARAIELGVTDFAFRPLVPDELRRRLDAALMQAPARHASRDGTAPGASPIGFDAESDTVHESLTILAAMADYHDDDTDQHAQRVGVVSAAIARSLGLPPYDVTMLRDAASLHDIGKVGISRRILLKPDKLTPSEWLHMQSHVDVGAEILATAQAPVFRLAAEIAQTHHERWDGTGYSAGLRGDEIALSGRIVAVADTWDVLTHQRPYRPAWPLERALKQIHAESGSHFDPAVVAAFSRLSAQELAGQAEPADVSAGHPAR